MTTRLPAWVAICAVFAARIPRLHAEEPDAAPGTKPLMPETQDRRQVAVIDLSEDPAVGALSEKIYGEVNGPLHDVLKIPDKRGLDSYLTGPMFDEAEEFVSRAIGDLKTAQTALDAADAERARSAAHDGERELAKVVPTSSNLNLYTDLTMIEGLAELELGHKQAAEYAFALTRRLDPNKSLDPAAFPPDIVAMFERASATRTVPFEVKGTGRVWIDWVDRGQGPATFDVEVGEHVIVLTGPDRITTPVMPARDGHGNERSLVTMSSSVPIDDAPASDAVKVKRARLALSRAQAKGDDAARASAMKQLADLLGIHDAVLVSKRADGKLQWETWRDRAPGFSAPQMYTNQKPAEILEPLVPPRPAQAAPVDPRPQLPPFRPVAPEGEQQWYQKGWVQASVAGGVILAIVGGILIASQDRPINFGNGDVKYK